MVNVAFLGLVSFFTDVATEMVYPVIPLYLMAVLGATPGLVGVIEGIAESVASLLKVFSGYIADRFQQKKGLAFAGYATGIIYKLVLIFAASWGGVLAARVVDRVGKGIRTAPRDVLVSESTDASSIGKAFGLHKALDMAGSALGILATFFLVSRMHGVENYKGLFAISIIPGVLGLFMFLFIRQTKTTPPPAAREPFWRQARRIDSQLKLYLVVVLIFTLGNSSNAFMLIRAKSAGFDDTSVILLYFLFSVVASVLAMPLGHLSDKIGRKKLLVAGYVTFAVCYTGFALSANRATMIGTFVLYGVYTALIAGIERAYVAEISPPDLKGTMLGLQATVAGIALLPASVIAGLLWDGYGPAVPFLFGASLSALAAVILLLFMRPRPVPVA